MGAIDDRVRLRRATDADATVIRDLTRSAYAKWTPIIGREPRPMQADYEAALRTHRFDLAYIDGRLAGVIEVVGQGDGLLIENVAVAPDFQRQGLGSILMAHAESVASALGCWRLSLYTNGRFEGNVRLYRRLGYEVSGEQNLGDGTIRVDMFKTLEPDERDAADG